MATTWICRQTIIISLLGWLFSVSALAKCPTFTYPNAEYESLQMEKGPFASDSDLALGYIERAEQLSPLPEQACERARLYNAVVQGDWPRTSPELLNRAGRELTEALFQAQDWGAVIESANDFLDGPHSSSKERERVHYLLIRAQSELVKASVIDIRQAKLALGLYSSQQFIVTKQRTLIRSYGNLHLPVLNEKCQPVQIANENFNEHAYRRSYDSYLRTHVDSPYTKEVKTWKDQAIVRLLEKDMEVADHYLSLKQYRAVIERLRDIFAWPPENISGEEIRSLYKDTFNRALYLLGYSFKNLARLAGLHNEFSFIDFIVLTPNLLLGITKDTLSNWMDAAQRQEKFTCQARYFDNDGNIMPKDFHPKDPSKYTIRYERLFEIKNSQEAPTLEEFARLNNTEARIVLEKMRELAPQSPWTEKLAKELE